MAVRPVLATGNAVDVDLRAWPAGVPLPWDVVGFEAEYDEPVAPSAGQTAASATRLRWAAPTPLALFGATAAAITDVAGNVGLRTAVADRPFAVRVGDVTGDGRVTSGDLARVAAVIRGGSTAYDPRADLDGDGDVDAADLAVVRGRIGQ